ncbi:MAG: hypothetical protein QM820_16310 [Minicystis sp.]
MFSPVLSLSGLWPTITLPLALTPYATLRGMLETKVPSALTSPLSQRTATEIVARGVARAGRHGAVGGHALREGQRRAAGQIGQLDQARLQGPAEGHLRSRGVGDADDHGPVEARGVGGGEVGAAREIAEIDEASRDGEAERADLPTGGAELTDDDLSVTAHGRGVAAAAVRRSDHLEARGVRSGSDGEDRDTGGDGGQAHPAFLRARHVQVKTARGRHRDTPSASTRSIVESARRLYTTARAAPAKEDCP